MLKNPINQTNTFKTPNIFIKSIITENLKILHKVFKTIRQPEKVSTNRSLYSDTKKE